MFQKHRACLLALEISVEIPTTSILNLRNKNQTSPQIVLILSKKGYTRPSLPSNPQMPPSTKENQTLGWIWPKDPRPGNKYHWPRRWRFFDVLTNKGPDIYVGVIGTRNPRTPRPDLRTNWTRWEDPVEAQDTPFPWARRGMEKYDCRRRKYTIPDQATWRWVEYCSGMPGKKKHRVPRRYWDRDANEYPAREWHDMIHGAHEDRW